MSEWAYINCICGKRTHINTKCSNCGGNPWEIGDPKPQMYQLKDGQILKNGHTMFLQDVVKEMNRKAHLEKVV